MTHKLITGTGEKHKLNKVYITSHARRAEMTHKLSTETGEQYNELWSFIVVERPSKQGSISRAGHALPSVVVDAQTGHVQYFENGEGGSKVRRILDAGQAQQRQRAGIVFASHRRFEATEKKCCSSSTNGLSESFLPRLYLSRQQFLLVNRSTWEARPADHTMEANLTTPASHVIVAHTGSAPCVTLSECSKITRVIQGFQMDDLGYADIAYNFLVGGDSQVYEGRGWDTQGALAAHYNNMSLGVAFIGIFEKTAPLMQQLEEFQTFLNVSVEKGKLSADYKLIGHRQVSITDSPGQALYNIIRTWSHWEDCYMKTCV
uniref:Uncharacterized protein n=1 Tax=Timema shepardi TaxID=629360 RepID=A0A7R9G3X5_TIMSH|nr:unnamed protein product [Timema shepardi]